MPKKYTFVGKSRLKKGYLLSIPSHIREAFSIHAGDSLEMHVEGNMLVLKPTKESVAGASGENNIVLFPALQQPSPRLSPAEEVKCPLGPVGGRIDRVV